MGMQLIVLACKLEGDNWTFWDDGSQNVLGVKEVYNVKNKWAVISFLQQIIPFTNHEDAFVNAEDLISFLEQSEYDTYINEDYTRESSVAEVNEFINVLKERLEGKYYDFVKIQICY